MWWTSFIEKLNKNSGHKKIQRQFVVILALLAIGYFLLGFWKFSFPQGRLIYGSLTTILAAGVLYYFPKIIQPLLYVWLLLGMVLGELMSYLILGIIYYLLFFPITFIKRKVGNKGSNNQARWYSRESDIIDYKKFY